ncbi:MAG: hypothetical protein IPO26_20130 [Saprospiraceae bacterium]|nr:hypothetical protein [Saprospiraceae bacterium]
MVPPSEDINNLSAGTYIVTPRGSNGCTATFSAIINNVNYPSPLPRISHPIHLVLHQMA